MKNGLFAVLAATVSTMFALVLPFQWAEAQEPVAKSDAAAATATPAKASDEREGTATVLHREDVLRDRGSGSRHLWPLLDTPEARVNYFEVTGRGALHFHPDADHRLYVLEGSVLVTCGATTTECKAGDFIIIPRGVRHCYDVAEAGGKALLLTFDAPPYDPKKTVSLEGPGAK